MTAVQVADQGISALIRGAVPPSLDPAFVALTHLGGTGVVLGLVALDYWFGDHERGAHAVGVVLGGLALVTALKALLAAPRPPESVRVIAASGFGFPSGHALGATVAYGVLAYDLRVGTRRLRYVAAGVVVALVALSRVVLGVHYVRDVVAGVVVGLAFLAVAFALTRRVPAAAFRLSAGVGVAAAFLSGASHDGGAVLGVTLGAMLVWEALDGVPAVDSRRGRALLLGGGVPALSLGGYAATAAGVPLPAALVLGVAVGAGIVAAPLLAGGGASVDPGLNRRPSGR